MIGNDLVYLPDWPQRQGLRLKRYRAKVFTTQELVFIERSRQPYRAEAFLWSVKEAAYKVWLKITQEPAFNPQNFLVLTEALLSGESLPKILEGEVSFKDGACTNCPFYSTLEDGFLSTYVTQQPGELISEAFCTSRPQFILHQNQPWKLQKSACNIPRAIYQARYLETSLSHDGGRFWYVWLAKPQSLKS